MTINQNREGSKLTIKIEGKLDTTTAPELKESLDSTLDGVTELIMDISNLIYISSAGLRVLLLTHKTMSRAGGSMTITGANETVMEIFDMTGFSDILNIE